MGNVRTGKKFPGTQTFKQMRTFFFFKGIGGGLVGGRKEREREKKRGEEKLNPSCSTNPSLTDDSLGSRDAKGGKHQWVENGALTTASLHPGEAGMGT